MSVQASLLTLFILSLLLPSSVRADWVSDTQSIMGTEVSVNLWHKDTVAGKKAIADVMVEMRRIDKALSPWIKSSELAKVNASAAAAPVPISPELSMLIQRSLHYSEISLGAFDITFASVGWHYDYREGKQPSKKLEQELRPAINFKHLIHDKNNKTLAYAHKNVRIDLGGIAKGYAVDRAINLLKVSGVKHASVSAGGDSRLLGDKKGRPWLIGIRNPRLKESNNAGEVVLTMPLDDVAVSTSGDYERYFIDQKTGERIHHIINPQTGRSAKGIMSVSVLGPNSVDADALSTTVFVLGVKSGLELIESLAGFDCVIIDTKGTVYYSHGLMPPEE